MPSSDTQGTLTLDYSYTNNAGEAETGTVAIPYQATTNNNVVATTSPAGQVSAAIGGSTPVTVTFNTDDGNAASNFTLTSSLSGLPSGWSSSASTLTCSSVSTGNSCQLALTYAPNSQGSGTVTLNYSYTDDAGTGKSGSVNIAYAATTNDNAVTTLNPSGTVSVNVGASQNVIVTFTTDDANTASALSISSDTLGALPSGWSSASSPFYCATFSTGNSCQLTLTYAPSSAGSGTASLPYSYDDNAGETKSGTVSISYQATNPPSYAYVADESGGAVYVCTVGSSGGLSGCTSTGGGFSSPMSVALDGSIAYVSTYSNGILQCSIDNDGTLSSCAQAASTSSAPSDVVINGSALYYADENSFGGPEVCSIGTDGALSNCASTDATTSVNQAFGVAFYANTAYVMTAGDRGLPGLLVCVVANGGALSSCADSGTGISGGATGAAVSQNSLYVPLGQSIDICAIGSNGTLSNCAASTPFTLGPDWYIDFSGSPAISAGYAYLPYSASNLNTMAMQSGVAICAVNGDGSLSNCADSGTAFNSPRGVAIH